MRSKNGFEPRLRDQRSRAVGLFLGMPLVIACWAFPVVASSEPAAGDIMATGTGSVAEDSFVKCLRAIQLGEAERLMLLWQQQPPDPNAYSADGKTLLNEAILIDRPEIVKWLIEKGADPNRKSGGVSPLHRAALKAGPETIGVLLAASVTIDLTNAQGETPLFLAMRPGRGPVVEKLLRSGANPNHVVGAGRTPLHQAAEWADARVVSLLLGASAAVHLADTDSGATPLHLAVIAGNVEIVKVLIQQSAPLNARDRQGSAPLQYAAGNPQIARLLIESGADVNLPGDGDRSPLHEAVQAGHVEVVKMLLDHRADRGARSRRGETPLELAKRLNRREIIELLEGR